MGVSMFIIVTVLCCFIIICEAQNMKKEMYMTTPQLISASGYPSERHRVVTADGYHLQMHRLPAGRRTARRSEPSAKGKPAVFIQHGLMGSSGDFVIMGPGRSLAYMLADAGFDVWLGNLRGTIYSSHKTLNRTDPKFWDFSFEEHGKYDVPAMIDGILSITGLPKILYIGYSMGTTSFFTMMSERPEYNDKLISFVGLAPAVYMEPMRPLATMLLKNLDMVNTLRSEGMTAAYMPFSNLCALWSPIEAVCLSVVYSIVGEDFEQNDSEKMEYVLARAQPASWKQLEHFGKIAMTGVFTAWEDGIWGKVRPYNLTNVAIPVSLFYGGNDQLTEKSQVLKLAAELKGNGILDNVGPVKQWPKFNHLDFVFAKDVATILNKPLIKYVKELFTKYG